LKESDACGNPLTLRCPVDRIEERAGDNRSIGDSADLGDMLWMGYAKAYRKR
jgi:hypothetical protein